MFFHTHIWKMPEVFDSSGYYFPLPKMHKWPNFLSLSRADVQKLLVPLSEMRLSDSCLCLVPVPLPPAVWSPRLLPTLSGSQGLCQDPVVGGPPYPSAASAPSHFSSFDFCLGSWLLVISPSFFEAALWNTAIKNNYYIWLFYVFAVKRKAGLHHLGSLLCCQKRSLVMDVHFEPWKPNV